MDYKAEIHRLKSQGYSVEDIYIYVKDYVDAGEFIDIYEGL